MITNFCLWQTPYFIFSKDFEQFSCDGDIFGDRTVTIIAYLFYQDTLSKYISYLNKIPKYLNVVVVSSDSKVLKKAQDTIAGSNVVFVKKPNVGRDVGALLVAAKNYIEESDYVCFVHDKKEHQSTERLHETDLWIENIWENTIGSEIYIKNIIGFFEKNNNYGVMTVPQPIGIFFDTWAGQGWYESFEVTKKLADKLGLNVEVQQSVPPITIGTALWFRPLALKKLFDYEWSYEDFNDEKLSESDYISYAVERVFSYVSEDAGYKTGIALTDKYASKLLLLAQNLATLYADTLNTTIGITLGYECIQIVDKIEEMHNLITTTSCCYIYGAGRWGRICLKLLRLLGITPKSFVVSQKEYEGSIDGVSVVSINDIQEVDEDVLFIVSVYDNDMREEITKQLVESKFKYFCLW